MRINLVTLCSGYDSQMMAWRQLEREIPGLEVNLVAWAEIDLDACCAHDAVFPEYAGRNLGDITKVDWASLQEPIDVLFASTPCQSVSMAGRREGMKKGSGAESALIWATEAAISALKPRVVMFENVKGMVSKKTLPDFLDWCAVVRSYGYQCYWKVLNACNYGLPQNRERVFLVCLRADQPQPYQFPAPVPLGECVMDRLQRQGVPASKFLPLEKTEAVLKLIPKEELNEIVRYAVELGLVQIYDEAEINGAIEEIPHTESDGGRGQAAPPAGRRGVD